MHPLHAVQCVARTTSCETEAVHTKATKKRLPVGCVGGRMLSGFPRYAWADCGGVLSAGASDRSTWMSVSVSSSAHSLWWSGSESSVTSAPSETVRGSSCLHPSPCCGSGRALRFATPRPATSVGQLRHDQMEQGPTEPHAGRSTSLLSSGAGITEWSLIRGRFLLRTSFLARRRWHGHASIQTGRHSWLCGTLTTPPLPPIHPAGAKSCVPWHLEDQPPAADHQTSGARRSSTTTQRKSGPAGAPQQRINGTTAQDLFTGTTPKSAIQRPRLALHCAHDPVTLRGLCVCKAGARRTSGRTEAETRAQSQCAQSHSKFAFVSTPLPSTIPWETPDPPEHRRVTRTRCERDPHTWYAGRRVAAAALHTVTGASALRGHDTGNHGPTARHNASTEGIQPMETRDNTERDAHLELEIINETAIPHSHPSTAAYTRTLCPPRRAPTHCDRLHVVT